MFYYRLLLYIKKRAKEEGKKIPSNYKEIIQSYIKIQDKIPYFLISCKGLSKSLNMNSGLPYIIQISYEWYYHMVCLNTEETRNAFLITIGHESGHKERKIQRKEKNPSVKYLLNYITKSNAYIFLSYVNEVKNDFMAVKLIPGMDRNALIKAIQYKIKYHIPNTKGDKIDSHPTFEKRLEYATHYNFNAILIHKIAEDVGFTDMGTIDRVCNYYKEIILKD